MGGRGGRPGQQAGATLVAGATNVAPSQREASRGHMELRRRRSAARWASPGIGKSNGLFHRLRPPTPCPPAPAGAHAWGRPARSTLPAWSRARPGRRPLPPLAPPPPCRPRATARGRPQLTSAQWRPPGAASTGRQTAAAGPARLGCWAGGAVGAAGGDFAPYQMKLPAWNSTARISPTEMVRSMFHPLLCVISPHRLIPNILKRKASIILSLEALKHDTSFGE